MLLADMGADVIRICRPGAKVGIEHVDRGRRIVRADLKSPADLADVKDLIGVADVLLESYRPGVLERIGLDPATLLKGNPQLVIGRLSAWGQSGPLSMNAGHDINPLALTGALAAFSNVAGPSIPLNLVADYGGGALYLALGVVVAAWQSQRTGKGQVIDCALCDGTLSLMSVAYKMLGDGSWHSKPESNLLDGGAPFYRSYRCADGRHIAVGAIETKFWRTLLRRLDLDDDQRFQEQHDRALWREQREILTDVFAKRTRDEWSNALAGIDACVSPVLDMSEAVDHAHFQDRSSFFATASGAAPAPAPRFGFGPSNRSTEHQGLQPLVQTWARRCTPR